MTGKLNAVERGLLATRVAKLRATLDPALTIQNWHSLGILDFVASVNKVRKPSLAMSMLYGILQVQLLASTAALCSPEHYSMHQH